MSVEFVDGMDTDVEFVAPDLWKRVRERYRFLRSQTGSMGDMAFPGLGDSVGVSLGLVNLAPWRYWTNWPRMVSSEGGQYLALFLYVQPDHMD